MKFKQVILVDEADREIGSIEKMEAHKLGLLHRAFSIFIINNNGEMLLQRRALSKYHSPGLWTNACCSHPQPGDLTIDAANTRLNEELGFQCELVEIASFTYKTNFDNSLTEHEFDHVLLGLYSGEINPDKEEVEEYKWISIEALESDLNILPRNYTFWFHIAYPLVRDFLNRQP
ncbi:MAG: isopentenyl-diphosphate Delta-isomerase [Sphingobacteriaceae bacterium]|nr:isopentenyl-diphosphate Delta-isomerase [Sphingobacteriaceae bacterium]